MATDTVSVASFLALYALLQWVLLGRHLVLIWTKVPTLRDGLLWQAGCMLFGGILCGLSRRLRPRWQRWGLAAGAISFIANPVAFPSQLLTTDLATFIAGRMIVLMLIGATVGAIVTLLSRRSPAKPT